MTSSCNHVTAIGLAPCVAGNTHMPHGRVWTRCAFFQNQEMIDNTNISMFYTKNMQNIFIFLLRLQLSNFDKKWHYIVRSGHRNAFHITGPLWWKSTGDRWPVLPVCKFLFVAWPGCGTTSPFAGDLRRHGIHVTSLYFQKYRSWRL